MKTTFKVLAIAGLMGTVSAPAFAAAHMDMATMTCAQYQTLSDEDKMKAASMALAELEDGGHGGSLITENTSEGFAPSDTTAEEATDAQETEGSLITDGQTKAETDSVDTMVNTDMEAAMKEFVTICAQNPDALVAEAAAGMRGKTE